MVERYADDLRADGAKAFFFQGGTTSPLTVYRDAGESSAHPIPVVADANGRWPDVFVPYTVSYDFQVKSKDDVQITFTLGVPNPNPVDLTVVIPPEERVSTGMIHGEFINASKPGYVRLNGRTIGNAASGASERATGLNNTNSDVFNLFQYLYNNVHEAIAIVSGGRTVSGAIADFNANKNIVLPDCRGSTFVGLDDMGNPTPANAFAGLLFNIGTTTFPAASIGTNSNVLSITQMPPHLHQGTTARHLGHQHTTKSSGDTGVELRTDNRNFAAHSHAWGTAGGSSGFVQGVNGRFSTYANSQAGYDLNHAHNYVDDFFRGNNQSATGGNRLNGDNSSQNRTTDTAINSGYNLDHAHFIDVGGTTATQDIAHFHNMVNIAGFTDFVSNATASGAHDHDFTTDTRGGTSGVAQPFNNMGLSRLVTWFIKL
jgi:hypothetical protein